MDSTHPLKRYAQEKRYFTPPKDRSVVAKYLSYQLAASPFDGGKTAMPTYFLEVDGVRQSWARPSKPLAEIMSEIPPGSLISILKTGEKKETKYVIQIIES